MDYEDTIKNRCKEYADAQAAVEEADRAESEAHTKAMNARNERDAIERELKQFVGRNIPRRVVLVEDRAVLIQMDLVKEVTYVSVERYLNAA